MTATSDPTAALPAWAPDGQPRTLQARCVRVEHETDDVATFVFRAPEPLEFAFKPGQFVVVEPVIDGRTVQRCYTVATPPSRPRTFAITVKRVPGGQVSNWLHDHLHPGAELTVTGPQGDFNCIDRPARRLLLLSGGSGITPVMSIARWLHDAAADADVAFVHSARTPQDIIFRRELELLEARDPTFRLSVVCAEDGGDESWRGPLGHLRGDLLQELVPDLRERTAYACGPEPYMETVRAVLDRLGFPGDRLHEESFGGGASASGESRPPAAVVPFDRECAEPATAAAAVRADAEPAATPAAEHEITLAGSQQRFTCGASETLLQAATRNGAWIPSACQMGVCGTCRVRKTTGTVRMEALGGISDADSEAGYVLACCSYPEGPVTLDC